MSSPSRPPRVRTATRRRGVDPERVGPCVHADHPGPRWWPRSSPSRGGHRGRARRGRTVRRPRATATEMATADGHSRSFDLQAHRGGVALTVENTLPAFAAALELGVSTLELDVQITEDGYAVVTHDRDLSPAKCVDTAPAFPGDPEFPYVPGRTYVKDLTLAQVRTVDCGSLRAPAYPDQVSVARRADAAAVRGARPRERLPGPPRDAEHRAEGRGRRSRADRAPRAVRPGRGGRGAGGEAPRPGHDPELRLGHADAHGRGGPAPAARRADQRAAVPPGRRGRARRRGSAASTSTTSPARCRSSSWPRRRRSAPTPCRPCTATRRTARSATRTTCRSPRPSWSTPPIGRAWTSCRGRSTTAPRWSRSSTSASTA